MVEVKAMINLPIYWTDDLRGLSVFDVIKDTLDKHPELLSEIKVLIRKLEFRIEGLNDR